VADSQAEPHPDHRLEQALGLVLRAGVGIAAVVVAAGGVLLFATHPAVLFTTFTGAREPLRTVPGIIDGAGALRGDALVQLGIILLIATPLLRVVFSLLAFLYRRDWLYAGFSLIVTAVLVAGLLGK
jgi:uncharacterized membrane protein